MSEVKHTPGPWKAEMVKGWGGDFCITNAEASKPIFKAIKPDAYYTDWPEGRDPGSKILSSALAEKQGRYVATPEIRKRLDEIEEANARLIAAAPDLLEALKTLDKRFKECAAIDSISARDAYDSFYQEVVSEVIKKATGQT